MVIIDTSISLIVLVTALPSPAMSLCRAVLSLAKWWQYLNKVSAFVVKVQRQIHVHSRGMDGDILYNIHQHSGGS